LKEVEFGGREKEMVACISDSVCVMGEEEKE
jgi:hypothetical protein